MVENLVINPSYPEICDAKISKVEGNEHLHELVCYDECGRESLKLRLTDNEVDVLSSAFYKISAYHQLFEKEALQCQ